MSNKFTVEHYKYGIGTAILIKNRRQRPMTCSCVLSKVRRIASSSVVSISMRAMNSGGLTERYGKFGSNGKTTRALKTLSARSLVLVTELTLDV